jgi:uncharacterized membrane protein YesL
MKYNPDGQLYKITTVFSQFILLNVLYLLFCLPVVTIGAATSALFEVTLRYADDERGELIAGFLRAFRANWKKATGAFVLLVLPIAALIYSGFFWFSGGTFLTSIIAVISFVSSGYFFLVLVYSLALFGRFENTFKQTIKNAFLLPLAEMVRSLGLLLIPITLFCLVVLFPLFKLLFALFGFAFAMYCSSFLLLAVFRHQRS